MSNQKTCAHCVHFLDNPEITGGVCRRYPPVAMMMPQPAGILGAGSVGMAGVNPPVNPEHTCGEWRVGSRKLPTPRAVELETLHGTHGRRDGK